MLDGKRIIIGTQADKLRNGLTKLASAREDVKKMTIDSDIKRAEVAKKSQECDILIVNAERESKDVKEKQKAIDIDKIKIAAETITASLIEEQAQRELDRAMPALNSA